MKLLSLEPIDLLKDRCSSMLNYLLWHLLHLKEGGQCATETKVNDINKQNKSTARAGVPNRKRQMNNNNYYWV